MDKEDRVVLNALHRISKYCKNHKTCDKCIIKILHLQYCICAVEHPEDYHITIEKLVED